MRKNTKKQHATPRAAHQSTRQALAFLFLIALLQAPPAAHADPPSPAWDWGSGRITADQSINYTSPVDLTSPVAVDVAADVTLHISGDIKAVSRPMEGLIKEGDGRLILSGNNANLHRELLLHQGTLHLGSSDAAGHFLRRIVAHAGTTLSYAPGITVFNGLDLDSATHGLPGTDHNSASLRWRVDEGMATHSGYLLGSLPIIKQGPGTLRLAGVAASPDSRLNIAQGGVQLDNHFAGHITVMDTGWLSGNGAAGWINVNAGGEVRPLGKITVHHHLELTPHSALVLRAWSDGQSDQMHSLGTATLNGHVLVLPQGDQETWATETNYVIVQADGGIGDSRFASVTSALPYLEPSLRYNANQVILGLQPRTVALQAQDRPLASGWAASARSTLLEDSRFIRDAVYLTGAGRAGFWTHAFHATNDRRRSSGAAADTRHITGALLGGNTSLNPRWQAGWYAGWSTTDMNGRSLAAGSGRMQDAEQGPATRITSAHFGLQAHGQYNWGTLTLGAAHSRHRLTHRRTASTDLLSHPVNSRHRARTDQIFARAAFNLWASRDQSLRVQPFISTAWVTSRDHGYTENGGPLAMHIDSERLSVLSTMSGIRAQKRLDLPQGEVLASGSLGWRYALGDIDRPARQHFRDDVRRATLSAHGQSLRRHGWDLQLGLQAEVSKTTHVGMHYSGYYAKGVQDHGAKVGLTMVW